MMRPLAPQCGLPSPLLCGVQSLQSDSRQPALTAECIRKGLICLVLLGLPAALFFALLGHPGGRAEAGSIPASGAEAVPHSRLGLMAGLEPGHVVLGWNWEAEPIKAANLAVLSITDGGHQEDVELDLSLLRGKRLSYSPLSNDVSFQLTVRSPGQNRVGSECVRVLVPRGHPWASRVSALQDQTPSR